MRPAALVVVLALAAAACATNPVTGRRELSLMSEDQEIQIGQEQDAQVRREAGVYADRELQQYVSDIGLRLGRVSERPNLPWHFTVAIMNGHIVSDQPRPGERLKIVVAG